MNVILPILFSLFFYLSVTNVRLERILEKVRQALARVSLRCLCKFLELEFSVRFSSLFILYILFIIIFVPLHSFISAIQDKINKF